MRGMGRGRCVGSAIYCNYIIQLCKLLNLIIFKGQRLWMCRLFLWWWWEGLGGGFLRVPLLIYHFSHTLFFFPPSG